MKLVEKIEHIETDKLIPYARNPRKHSEEQISQVMGSIKEFGFVNPVLIKDDQTIIAGHCRIIASQRLGLEKVPCIRLSHLTPTQAKAFVLADNQLALNSTWDDDLLKLELEDLKLDEFDLDLLGFDLTSLNDNWDSDIEAIDKIDENLDGITAVIKISCPQEIKDEVLIYIKAKFLETSFEGVHVE